MILLFISHSDFLSLDLFATEGLKILIYHIERSFLLVKCRQK